MFDRGSSMSLGSVKVENEGRRKKEKRKKGRKRNRERERERNVKYFSWQSTGNGNERIERQISV